MSGFDVLGADTALANEYVTLRIKGVDPARVRQKLGSLAAGALPFVEMAPKAALDIAAPIVASKARDYGIDAEVNVATAPAGKKRAFSEFFPGLVFGVVLGGASLVIVKGIARLVRR